MSRPEPAAAARRGWRASTSGTRVLVMLGVGLAVGLATGLTYRWRYAPLTGWGAAAATFVIWAWAAVWRMDAVETQAHATREDASRSTMDLLLLGANVASLIAVASVVIDAGHTSGVARGVLGAAALASVAVSWVLVQTLFTLRYARLYYAGEPGGVDFNTDALPDYHDFAYLAFTMGMAYQVSDTALRTSAFRRIVLRHALLSYVFGSVILATTINLVVGLSS